MEVNRGNKGEIKWLNIIKNAVNYILLLKNILNVI